MNVWLRKKLLTKLLQVDWMGKDQNWTSCHSQMTADISVRPPMTVSKWKAEQRE